MLTLFALSQPCGRMEPARIVIFAVLASTYFSACVCHAAESGGKNAPADSPAAAVTGKVILNGAPLNGGVLSLVPLSGERITARNWAAIKPAPPEHQIRRDGSFTLPPYAPGAYLARIAQKARGGVDVRTVVELNAASPSLAIDVRGAPVTVTLPVDADFARAVRAELEPAALTTPASVPPELLRVACALSRRGNSVEFPAVTAGKYKLRINFDGGEFQRFEADLEIEDEELSLEPELVPKRAPAREVAATTVEDGLAIGFENGKLLISSDKRSWQGSRFGMKLSYEDMPIEDMLLIFNNELGTDYTLDHEVALNVSATVDVEAKSLKDLKTTAEKVFRVLLARNGLEIAADQDGKRIICAKPRQE